ncbi:DUF1106 domain-containing protein, partial [Staphylococcus warneri]
SLFCVSSTFDAPFESLDESPLLQADKSNNAVPLKNKNFFNDKSPLFNVFSKILKYILLLLLYTRQLYYIFIKIWPTNRNYLYLYRICKNVFFKLIVILLKSTIILYFKFESFINLLYFKVGSVFTTKNYTGVMLYEEIN